LLLLLLKNAFEYFTECGQKSLPHLFPQRFPSHQTKARSFFTAKPPRAQSVPSASLSIIGSFTHAPMTTSLT
jgi:hypothetical protein